MTRLTLAAALSACALAACAAPSAKRDAASAPPASYFDTTGRTDLYDGGVRMIPVTTPKGTFKVWTKRTGNNPKIKVLLLHGGPGMTHEYWEPADSYFPAAGVEYYYYDQLGSYYSDQPRDTSLWNTARFVEEVEQVRTALGMDSTNFYLMGSSWGGLLAMEYALKYQKNLKGLVVSNMTASVPAYVKYAEDVLNAEEGLRQPALHGAPGAEPLREAPAAPARRPVARRAQPRAQARQQRHLHPHAGAQ